MSKFKRFTVLATLGLLIVVIWHIGSKYTQFQASLIQIRGLKLSDTREEVLYRQGNPTHVIDPEKLDLPESRGFHRVYTVNAKPDDVNRMPDGKRVADFLEWQYETPGEPTRLTVVFGKNGLVKSLSIYCTEGLSACWEPIAGIESAADEEKVLRLGAPQLVKIESATKTVKLENIGITVYLNKGKTYMIEIAGPQQPGSMHVARFLRTLL
jgi:hypothetical protein